MPDCPICATDHPTGRFTQTFGGVRHRSRECAYVASRSGLSAGGLRAAKRRLEQKAAWCADCGALTTQDRELCGRCAQDSEARW